MARLPWRGRVKISWSRYAKTSLVVYLALLAVGLTIFFHPPFDYKVTASEPASYLLPTKDGQVVPPVQHKGRQPSEIGEVTIEGIGSFEFNPEEIETIRPDVLQPGHFSLFDILVHLDSRGDINLTYHFDETMNTHVIDAIDGETGWWYWAHYSGGWPEQNAFRMDMYPYKDGTTMRLYQKPVTGWNYIYDSRPSESIYESFRDEVDRLRANGGEIIIPQVTIKSIIYDINLEFTDVVVTPYNVRDDVFKPGVVTALDILLSLLEQGKLSQIKLTWFEQLGTAEVVDGYWTEQINQAVAHGSCGFVYETGPLEFPGFYGNHIHIPSDDRAIVSPEYAKWFWICI
jgi:hypothetical protein